MYGIVAIDESDNELQPIDYIPSVFSTREAAENFVGLLVTEQLDIIHLHDVIEDVVHGKST